MIIIIIIIIIIIPNKQITNISTNTKDSDNHCKKYKNFTQKFHLVSPHRETRRNFPISRNEQMQNVYKNLKKYKKYIIFFFFRYIAER